MPPKPIQNGGIAWQTTLRDALTNGCADVPFVDLWERFYTVPAAAGKILETHPSAELLPFLAKLRNEPPSWKAGVVDEWITIVRNGLHGMPESRTDTLTNAKGVVIATNSISYYGYVDRFLQRWNARTNRLQMSLAVLKTNDWDYPRLEVTFRNIGADDLYLNLGFILANGRLQLPSKIHLTLCDDSGRNRELDFEKDWIINGRADDFAVPLRSGSSYTLELRLDQFWSPATKEFDLKLKPGHYRVSAWFQGTGAEYFNTGSEGVALMNFWKGRIQSNACPFIE